MPAYWQQRDRQIIQPTAFYVPSESQFLRPAISLQRIRSIAVQFDCIRSNSPTGRYNDLIELDKTQRTKFM